MTQVKICGLTRPQDVELACALGAAYVGLNFASVSPRRVTVETARELVASVPSGVARVGVFVGEETEAGDVGGPAPWPRFDLQDVDL